MQLLQSIYRFIVADNSTLKVGIVILIISLLLQGLILRNNFTNKQYPLVAISLVIQFLYVYGSFTFYQDFTLYSLMLLQLMNFLESVQQLRYVFLRIFQTVSLLFFTAMYIKLLINTSQVNLIEPLCVSLAMQYFITAQPYSSMTPTIRTGLQKISIARSHSLQGSARENKVLSKSKTIVDSLSSKKIDYIESYKKLQSDVVNDSFGRYRNVFNMFPSGIIVVNHTMDNIYVNTKCEKIFEQSSKEEILLNLKSALDNPVFGRSRQNKDLEDIINKAKENHQDVLTSLVRYVCDTNVTTAPNHILKQFSQQLQLSRQFSEDVGQKVTLLYTYQSKKNRLKQKQLKIEINNFLYQDLNASINANNSLKFEDSQPKLLIIIKNATNQNKIEKLKNELQFQNSLLKSFSHELKTPLNGSVQLIENALQKYQKDELLEQAIVLNKLLILQINDILDFASLQISGINFNPQQFVVKDLLDEIIHLFQHICQTKNIKLSHSYDFKDQFSIITDRMRLMQVVTTLLSNSLKFTHANGKIMLLLKNRENGFKLIIKDNGVGIEWDRFQNIAVTSKFQGIGLNVASRIIYGLTQDHLQIKSAPQQGTKASFIIKNYLEHNNPHSDLTSQSIIHTTLRLPIIGKQPRKKQYNFNSSSSGSNVVLDVLSEGLIHSYPKSMFASAKNQLCNCAHILLVDDIPFNLQALEGYLKRFNIFKVDKAYDGLQALQFVKDKANRHCQTYRLILMDIEMPIMNGFQATREILKFRKTNIVMCSAYDTLENSLMAKQVGMLDQIIKPVQRSELERILNIYYLKQ